MNFIFNRFSLFSSILLIGFVPLIQGCMATDITRAYLGERCKLSYEERQVLIDMEAEGLETNDMLEFYCVGKRDRDARIESADQ